MRFSIIDREYAESGPKLKQRNLEVVLHNSRVKFKILEREVELKP